MPLVPVGVTVPSGVDFEAADETPFVPWADEASDRDISIEPVGYPETKSLETVLVPRTDDRPD